MLPNIYILYYGNIIQKNISTKADYDGPIKRNIHEKFNPYTFKTVNKIAEYLKNRTKKNPTIGIVCGMYDIVLRNCSFTNLYYGESTILFSTCLTEPIKLFAHV